MDYITRIRSQLGSQPIQLNFAAACILNSRGEVLLHRRSDDGRWGLPGGALEYGETAHDAVVREVQEETGLTVEVVDLLGVYTGYEHVYPNGDVTQPICIYFRCRQVGEGIAVAGHETTAVGYFPPADPPPLSSNQHRDVLADLLAERHGVYR
jgi:mutator protein MutT